MMSMKQYLVSAAACAALCACGGAPEPAPEVDHGAGTVVKADDALDAIVSADYVIEKLAGDLVFTEGPLWIREGGPHLLFSDVPGNRIYKWAPDGTLSDYKNPVFEGEFEAGQFIGPNGLTLDPEGRLVVCEHGARRVSRLDADGNLVVVVDNYQGKRLNSPNDVVFKSDGSMYFTDPPYGMPGQDDDPAKELDFNGVFRLSPDGSTLELLNDEQTRPNGVAFSPDEKTLYVGNSDGAAKIVYAYDVLEDGKLGPKRVFLDVTSEQAPGAPDGLKLDKQGNIYTTGPGGIWIVSPEGKHLGTIQPEEVPANSAWGDDGKTLYMTARTGLYRIRLNAEGAIL